MSIKKCIAALIAFAVAFCTVGCSFSSRPGESGEKTVVDMIGREVQVTPAAYRRVVCIGAGALRMYTYVGDVSLLCGVEDIDNTTLQARPKMFDKAARPYLLAHGDLFATLPSCGVGGPNAQTAEPEKILSCEPDIVISEYEDVDMANALQAQLGVPVITLKTGTEGVFGAAFVGSMRLLGEVFGRTERAEALLAFLKEQTDAIRARTDDVSRDRPSVYICGLGSWGTTNHLATAERYSTFEVANIKNAVSGLGFPGVGMIEQEMFVTVAARTDIMFIDAAAVKNIRPLYAEDAEMFDACRAWQNGEVYLQMAYNAYYTNYEIALANAWFIAKTVYPDRFADIDMHEKMAEITEAFLGQDLADAIFACETSFGGYRKIDTETFFSADR